MIWADVAKRLGPAWRRGEHRVGEMKGQPKGERNGGARGQGVKSRRPSMQASLPWVGSMK